MSVNRIEKAELFMTDLGHLAGLDPGKGDVMLTVLHVENEENHRILVKLTDKQLVDLARTANSFAGYRGLLPRMEALHEKEEARDAALEEAVGKVMEVRLNEDERSESEIVGLVELLDQLMTDIRALKSNPEPKEA